LCGAAGEQERDSQSDPTMHDSASFLPTGAG
jgi:hypothetical protein